MKLKIKVKVLTNGCMPQLTAKGDWIDLKAAKDIDINATNEIEAGTSLSHTVGNANISTQGTIEKSTRRY